MRRSLAFLLAAFVALTVGTPSAHALGRRGLDSNEQDQPSGGNRPTEPGDTLTWWCLDLNNFWQVDIPVLAGRVFLDYAYAETPPIPDQGCGNAWPVTVPGGSQFVPGGSHLWTVNNTYPKALREALEASGYHFRSQSPAEDLLAKVVSIRVEIRTAPAAGNEFVAEYTFDAQKYFRRTLLGFFRGMLPTQPIVNEALGVDISAAAVRRLPSIGFPVPAGPLPAGTPQARYAAYIYWTLSESHNDGLGLDEGNFLPAGEYQYEELVRLEYVP